MKLEVRLGSNGYDIRTPQCREFDLADAEIWSYLGLSDSVAELLAGGFPVYWDAKYDAANKEESADTLAAKHRSSSIQQLAKSGELPEAAGIPTPFKDLYDRRKWIADGHFEPYGSTKTSYDFYKGTKLEAKHKQRAEEARKKNRKPLTVSFDEWRNAACKLFDNLREQPDAKLRPGALLVTGKKRLQREGQPARERGNRLVRQGELESAFAASATNQIQWGPLLYDTDLVNDSHFCAVGLARMGKTTLLRLLFQSIYRTQPDARFVLYDAKADLIPALYPPEYFETERTQEQVDSEFYILNPYDARCVAWDIAADAQDLDEAGEVAAILFPQIPNKEYFTPAMRAVAAAVMDALTRMAGGPSWTFYDLLCALRGNNLEAVLETTDHGKETIVGYLKGKSFAAEDTFKLFMACSDSWLRAAHAWLTAKRSVSLRSWVRNDSKSIVLMNHDQDYDGVNDMNRIILGLLFRLMFAKKHDRYRTFFYLDEFENLGRIECILRAMKQGASKRLNLALCLHDLGLLRKEYDTETEGLLTQCSFLAFLQMQNPETIDWASRILGTHEKVVKVSTTHLDEEGKPTGTSFAEHPQSNQLVIPDELTLLPSPKVSRQITGYFITPSHPRYRGTMSLAQLFDGDSEEGPVLWPASERVKEFAPREQTRRLPDDKFFTLYQLGFRKEGYSPPAIEESVIRETSNSQASQVPSRLTGTGKLKGRSVAFELDD